MRQIRQGLEAIKQSIEARQERNRFKQEVNFRCATVSDILPYRVYDEGEGLFYNANSYGFILEIAPFCGADQTMIDTLTGMITDGVPQGCTIQFLNYASPQVEDKLMRWRASRDGSQAIYQSLVKKRTEFYKSTYLDNGLNRTDFTVREFRVFVIVSMPDDVLHAREELQRLKKQLSVTIKTMGSISKELKAKEFINLLDELMCPQHGKRGEYDPLTLLNEHILQGNRSLEVKQEELVFRQAQEMIVAKSYSTRKFPSVWAQWMNGDLLGDFYSKYLQIPCSFITTLIIYFGDSDKSKEMSTRAHLNSIRKSSSGLGKFIPKVFDILKDWEFVVRKLNDEGQKLVQVYHGITLFSAPERMDSCERALKALYESKNWVLNKVDGLQLQSWLGTLPFMFSEGMVKDFKYFHRMKNTVTWTCANIAPLQGEWKGMDSPLMLLFTRRGQPFYWDIFANKDGNYNVTVVGKSGSGKSVFMQELTASIRGKGGNVFVIDDGRSFMNSCKLQKGQFIEFSGEQKICLNPFAIIDADKFDEGEGEESDFKKESYRSEVVNLIKGIVSRMCKGEEEPDSIEASYISQAILSVWHEKQRKATVNDIAEYFAKHEDARARDLGIMMHNFTEAGVYGYLFNGEEGISITNPFTVFELMELQNKKELQSVVFYTLMFMATEAMQRCRNTNSALVVEEAWSFLTGGVGAEFIKGVAKRARKYNGSLITGTQSIEDFYKSEGGRAALDNADFKCFLAQAPEAIERLKKEETVPLTSDKEKALTSLAMVEHEYAEIMICAASGNWVVGRLILDYYSMALYSSKGEDFERIKQQVEQGVPLEEAIEISAKEIEKAAMARR